jgi:hypothetical protein
VNNCVWPRFANYLLYYLYVRNVESCAAKSHNIMAAHLSRCKHVLAQLARSTGDKDSHADSLQSDTGVVADHEAERGLWRRVTLLNNNVLA